MKQALEIIGEIAYNRRQIRDFVCERSGASGGAYREDRSDGEEAVAGGFAARVLFFGDERAVSAAVFS